MNESLLNTTGISSNLTSSLLQDLSLLNNIVSFLNFLLGFPLHSYVVFLIATGRGRGLSDFIYLNLSVCETILCLNCFFFLFQLLGSNLFVALNYFFSGLAYTGRPLFLSLMCVERFLAVVHPVTFLKFKPLRYRIFCCSVAWSVTLGSCFFRMFTLVSRRYELNSWTLSTQLLILFSVQFFCLVSVLRALRQSGPGERKEENHRKRRALNIILITTVTMVIMHVPYTVTGLVTALLRFLPALWIFSFACSMLASFVQPVFFLHRTGKLSCGVKVTHQSSSD